MKKFETTNTFVTGVFPDTVADDSTGAATQDGFEYIAANLNNSQLGPLQAIMDYGAGNSNPDVGTVGVPNGVTEAAGTSQLIEAMHKMTGTGPGTYRQWGKFDDPSVTGDRVLLLTGQGVLVASFPDLNDAVWVGGDTANQQTVKDAGGYFYRADDAAGVTVNAAGAWLILSPGNPTYKKQYIEGTDYTITGTTSIVRGVAVPYQTSDGAWRLTFNFNAAAASATTETLTFNGITAKSGFTQSLAVSNSSLAAFAIGQIGGGGNTISVASSAVQTTWTVTADIELDSEPTWADDHTFPQGIIY